MVLSVMFLVLAFVIQVRWHLGFQIKLLLRNNLIYREMALQTLHLISPSCFQSMLSYYTLGGKEWRAVSLLTEGEAFK